jgi:hypothetical protein
MGTVEREREKAVGCVGAMAIPELKAEIVIEAAVATVEYVERVQQGAAASTGVC